MNTSTFLAVFPRHLRYWTIHCLLNALPSLIIALVLLGLWKSPVAIAAMASGIGTFILLFTTFTSSFGPLADETHVISRALKLGMTIRGWMILTSALILPIVKTIFVIPDLWCGMIAIRFLNRVASFCGAVNSSSFRPRPGLGISGFFHTYATTMVNGLILSFLVLMISFFALIFLQARDRKRVFAVADPP